MNTVTSNVAHADATSAPLLRRRIFINELSLIIGKEPTTIRTCATAKGRMHCIPRPHKLPNSRKLCWYEDEVVAWLAKAQDVHPNPPPRAPMGPPTKVERVEAARVGMSIKEWRTRQVGEHRG